MRTCQSCGRQNPPENDFCECGEYLRWDPTGFMEAVTPEAAQQAAAAAAAPGAAPPAAPQAPVDPHAPVAPGNGGAPADPYAQPGPAPTQAPQPYAPDPHAQPPAPQQPYAPDPYAQPPAYAPAPADPYAQPPAAPAPPPTAVQAAAPVPQPGAYQQPAEPELATMTLRLPEGQAVSDEVVALGVVPGDRSRLLCEIRNTSGIVDNYRIVVEGLPDEWWTVYPDTIYLNPFGTGGTYEQEVEVHFHPPRSPEAHARMWDLRVSAMSQAHARAAASKPAMLGIQPYEEFESKVKPERRTARRKAEYDVEVRNKANAPITVLLDVEDPDQMARFEFSRRTTEIGPGEKIDSKLILRSPRRNIYGRAIEHRYSVLTKTGEEAEAILAAEGDIDDGYDLDGEEHGGGGKGRKAMKGKGPKVTGPKVRGPQIGIGPGGVRMRGPKVTGPRMTKPRVPSKNLELKKLPGMGGGGQQFTMPLLPNQISFSQKPWLPWWTLYILILLLIALFLLFFLLPKNVIVPDVSKAKGEFEAQKIIEKAGLTLGVPSKTVPDPERIGQIVAQVPKAGEKAKKGAPVTLQIAVGDGNVTVPKVVGLSVQDALALLKKSKLTLGAATPPSTDPLKDKIKTQLPPEGDQAKEGEAVQIFLVVKKAGGEDGKGGKDGGAAAGGEGGDVVVPAIDGAKAEAYAKKVAEAGLSPEVVNSFSANAEPGQVFDTDPVPGTKVKAGDTVRVLVAAGSLQVAYDDGLDVLIADGATGKLLDPLADGPQKEKDPAFSFDGATAAYISGPQIFLKDLLKPKSPAKPITPSSERYTDPTWAPTAEVATLAANRLKGKDGDLCVGEVSGTDYKRGCITEPSHFLGRVIRWAPDGKTILAWGTKPPPPGASASGEFGMVEYRSKKPFSPDAKDWGKGRFVTDTTTPGRGVLDAAISPNGKFMAVVANFEKDTPAFRLYFTVPGDYALEEAKVQPVNACKATWRPDSLEVIVVRADDCRSDTGEIIRVDRRKPRDQVSVAPLGDNPDVRIVKADK